MPIKQGKKPQFNPQDAERKSVSHDKNNIAFSFGCITTNKKYNFDYFGKKDRNNKWKAYSQLYDKILKLSEKNWSELLDAPKKSLLGFECIPYGQIKFDTPKATYLNLSKDTNIYVFRFGSGDFRLLGIKRDGCPILHIIGFDFDFSSYDHGN